MELFGERGFELTTVAAIADHAGLTERTFFRHYADKREVLFCGSSEFAELLMRRVADAPAGATAIDAIAAALATAGELFSGRLDETLQRRRIIDAHAELQERGLIKLAALATSLAEALRQRGVGASAARLAGEAGVAVYKIAFDRWLEPSNTAALSDLIRESLDELKAVIAGNEQR